MLPLLPPQALSQGELTAALYNIACCRARLGDVENGLVAIAGAVEQGEGIGGGVGRPAGRAAALQVRWDKGAPRRRQPAGEGLPHLGASSDAPPSCAPGVCIISWAPCAAAQCSRRSLCGGGTPAGPVGHSTLGGRGLSWGRGAGPLPAEPAPPLPPPLPLQATGTLPSCAPTPIWRRCG